MGQGRTRALFGKINTPQRDTRVNVISGNSGDDVLLGHVVLRSAAAGKLVQCILALPASPLCPLLQSPQGPCCLPGLGQGDRDEAIGREATSQALTQQEN